MMILIALLLALSLLAVGALWLLSPGKPYPLLDQSGKPLAGGLVEKTRVPIHGMEQGMFLQSQDETNPVLLFLHGGPGIPEYWLTRRYPTGLEALFTVCWWEQRGSGLSYRADLPPEAVTVEQLIADTLAVTHYLRERFGRERITLMAHSGGSFYGIQAAARAPELYQAYVGMEQISYQLQSERLAYDYMLARFQERGERSMVRRLEAARPAPDGTLPAAYYALRDPAMHRLGIGTTREMRSVITGVFLPSLLSPVYTVGEKVALWRGKFSTGARLRDTLFATDLTRQVTELRLPTYFLHGRYDYTVSYSLAKAFYAQIKAPQKGFYTFEQSAHSPLFEEPERLRRILLEDVLAGRTSLANAG